MKVRMLRWKGDGSQGWEKGKTYDLPESQANAWIAKGYAEPAEKEPEKPKTFSSEVKVDASPKS